MTSQRPVAAVTDVQGTDLVADAVGATSAAYTRNPRLDVRQQLAEELARRGVGRRSAAWMDHVAEAVRAGHSADLVRDPSRQFPTSSGTRH